LGVRSGGYSGGGGFGRSPFFEKFFQFARVFQEKNAKTPLNFLFYKKNFWIRPWVRSNSDSN